MKTISLYSDSDNGLDEKKLRREKTQGAHLHETDQQIRNKLETGINRNGSTSKNCPNPIKDNDQCSSPEKILEGLEQKHISSGNKSAQEQFFVECLAREFNLSRTPYLPLRLKILIDGRFRVKELIGAGTFGNVYSAVCADFNDFPVALKLIKTRHMMRPCLLREINVFNHLRKLDPHCCYSFAVKLYQATVYRKHLFLVYELLGPNLRSVLSFNQNSGLPIHQIHSILLQLCLGVNFLHIKGLIHHDIKPDNIVFVNGSYSLDPVTGTKVMHRTEVRLIDFGSTVIISKDSLTAQQKRLQVATTIQYRAPEIEIFMIDDLQRHFLNPQSDMWSIGCTLFEMLTGRILFSCQSELQKVYLLEKILGLHIPLELGKLSRLSCFDKNGVLKNCNSFPELEETRKNLQGVKSLQEWKSELLLQHPQMSIVFDLLMKLLKIRPEERINSAVVFQHSFLRHYCHSMEVMPAVVYLHKVHHR